MHVYVCIILCISVRRDHLLAKQEIPPPFLTRREMKKFPNEIRIVRGVRALARGGISKIRPWSGVNENVFRRRKYGARMSLIV